MTDKLTITAIKDKHFESTIHYQEPMRQAYVLLGTMLQTLSANQETTIGA